MRVLLIFALTVFSISGFASTYPVLSQSNPFSGSSLIVPNNQEKRTSVVMLHGSEGGSAGYINSEATILATQGFAVLTLCYFDCNRGITGPRQTLKDVEATLVLDAVKWLRAQPQSNGQVVVYGFSRGAELTVITGSLPFTSENKPSGLIAHAPSDEFVGPWNWSWREPSCWLCKYGIGKCSESSSEDDFVWNPSCGPDDIRKMDFSKSAWLVSGKSIPEKTRIEIEKYDGPILITVGEKDEVWPADQTRRIEATLKKAGRTPQVHYFPNGGHGLRGADELKRRELVLDFLHALK